MFVVVNLARCRSQSVFPHATPPLRVRFRNDLTRIGLVVDRRRDAPRIFWASKVKGNRTRFEGRGGEKEKEGEEIILIPLARSLGATFSRSLWGRGREKKKEKRKENRGPSARTCFPDSCSGESGEGEEGIIYVRTSAG